MLRKIKTITRAIKEIIKATIKGKPQAIAHIVLTDTSNAATLSVYSIEITQGEALSTIRNIAEQALNRASTEYAQLDEKKGLTSEDKK